MSEPQNREMLTREAPVELGDGRTLVSRIVPYNVSTRVADPPDYTPYDEMFVPGAFERQTRAANRLEVNVAGDINTRSIWLNFEHDQSLRGIVGHGIKLEEQTDGLYGEFSVHENADGDKALQLVRDGLLGGLSVEFAALRSTIKNGLVQRVKAHIDKVSLCRVGAYPGAEVLAVREPPPVTVEPMTFNPELAERLAKYVTVPPNLLSTEND